MTRSTRRFEYPTPSRGRIPAFHSIDEEAEFWDTHDVSDFLEESTPVDVVVEMDPVSVPLGREDRQELDRQAAAQGMTSARLAGTWLRERLEAEREAG